MANDKIRAYSGNKPYIFISYAHRNSAAVYPIIQRMAADGFRIWYDEGIDPGTEWDENIASHVEGCGYFLAFISPQYIESENCKDELNYARDENKERVLIYLEQTQLPKGMSMRLNRLQAIHKYVYSDENEFFSKLYSSNGIETFTDNPAVLKAYEPKTTTSNTTSSYSSNTRTTTNNRTTTHTPVSITSLRTIGASSGNDLFPSGDYSSAIDRNRFPTMCFHMDVSNVPNKSKISFTVKVYDSYNNLVFNVNSSIDWKPEYCRISKAWNIGVANAKPGDYRVVATVEDSAPFSYNFSIVSGSQNYGYGNSGRTNRSNGYNSSRFQQADIQKIIKLRRKLAYPRALLWMFLTLVGFGLFVGMATAGSPILTILGLAAFITMLVFNIRYTKKHIVDSTFLAIILCTLLIYPYGLFVLIMAIITKVKEREYRRELAAEESLL